MQLYVPFLHCEFRVNQYSMLRVESDDPVTVAVPLHRPVPLCAPWHDATLHHLKLFRGITISA